MHVDNHTRLEPALFHVHANGLVGVIQLVLSLTCVLAGHCYLVPFNFLASVSCAEDLIIVKPNGIDKWDWEADNKISIEIDIKLILFSCSVSSCGFAFNLLECHSNSFPCKMILGGIYLST